MSRFNPDRIRQARLAAGLTQAGLARAAATSERNIFRWERGFNAPRAQFVAAIAAATGREINYFFEDGAEQEVVPAEDDPFREVREGPAATVRLGDSKGPSAPLDPVTEGAA